jgi:hypothetical protein
MKLFLPIVICITLAVSSCDKVKNAYPPNLVKSALDWSLYPNGDSAHYVAQGLWPTFSPNTNTLKNVLIEDYTGHRCFNCPNAATLLHTLETANPGRVFGASVHTSAVGMSSFQETDTDYPTVLYNDYSFQIGSHFGSQPGTSFIGNPHGTVNRFKNGTDNTAPPGSWSGMTSTELAAPLKVNLQAVANYFSSTRGLFLHVEVDKIDAGLTSDLSLVVYVLEDSIVGPQLMPNLSKNDTYIHRDVLRDCIGGNIFGRAITDKEKLPSGKYQLNYSYKIPTTYNADNLHLLIYVINNETEEVCQVIHQDIQ